MPVSISPPSCRHASVLLIAVLALAAAGCPGIRIVVPGPGGGGGGGAGTPGTGAPPAAGEPVVFRRQGTFLTATVRDPYRRFEIPAPARARYRRAIVEFDFRLGQFNTNLFHTVTSLRGDGLFCALIIRGSNRRTIVDVGGREHRSTGPWRPGERYRIRIVYDVPRGRVEMTASQGGRVVDQIAGAIRKTDLGPGRRTLRIDFSQENVVDNAFYPLWGSRFSDLSVRLEP